MKITNEKLINADTKILKYILSVSFLFLILLLCYFVFLSPETSKRKRTVDRKNFKPPTKTRIKKTQNHIVSIKFLVKTEEKKSR